MQCPNCGSENRDAAKFCDECGLPLGGAIARAAASEPLLKSVPSDNETESALNSAENASDAEEQPADEPDRLDEAEETPFSSAELEIPDSPESSHDDSPVSSAAEEAAAEAEELQAEADAAVSDSAENGVSESELQDITEIIGAPELASDVTRALDEDEFAGFTKHADDDFSFSDPLSYDGTDRNALNSAGPGFTMKMPRVEGEPAEKNRDFMASSTVPQKSRAKLIGIIAAVVVLVAAAVAAAFALGLWGGKTVPDVVNMTETDARAVLEDTGFTVRATQVKSDDTEGLVLIMDPAAGTRVPEGSEVIIHIATARLVPDLVGKTVDEANALLAEEGFDNIVQEPVKSEGEEGLVLSVSPETGTRAKSTVEIKLGVSEAYRVPDVSGMYWDDAFAAVRDAGLQAQVVYVSTEYYPEGSIIGTTPEAGTVVSEGELISINIAQSRATLLTQLTQNMLVPGSTVNVNGYNFTIDALGAVSYAGNDTVAFTFTGRPYVSLLGEVIHASSQTVSGQVVWSPSNEVVSITG